MTSEQELLEAVVAAVGKVTAEAVILPTLDARLAWDALMERMEHLRQWRLHRHDSNGTSASVQPCEECGASIFFAQLGSGRWIPVEVDQVDASEVIPSWRYVVEFSRTVGRHIGPPSAAVVPSMERGLVYVDHRETCGNRDGVRFQVPAYWRRWRVNATQMDAGQAAVIEELREQLRHLEDE